VLEIEENPKEENKEEPISKEEIKKHTED